MAAVFGLLLLGCRKAAGAVQDGRHTARRQHDTAGAMGLAQLPAAVFSAARQAEGLPRFAAVARSQEAMMSAASQVRLPVRVEPVQGESALGYALRLAERNGYERWHWLLPCDSAMGAQWLGQLSKRDVEALCRLASADLDAMAKLGAFGRSKAEVELGGSLATPNQFINRRWPKGCPACLSERGYLPWAWDLVLWTVCPVHGCWLIDKCPGCGERLSWNRAHVDRCCDRAPLSAMPSSPAPASLVSLMRVMARVRGCNGPLPIRRWTRWSGIWI